MNPTHVICTIMGTLGVATAKCEMFPDSAAHTDS